MTDDAGICCYETDYCFHDLIGVELTAHARGKADERARIMNALETRLADLMQNGTNIAIAELTIALSYVADLPTKKSPDLIELTPAWRANGDRPACDGRATCEHLHDECGKDNV